MIWSFQVPLIRWQGNKCILVYSSTISPSQDCDWSKSGCLGDKTTQSITHSPLRLISSSIWVLGRGPVGPQDIATSCWPLGPCWAGDHWSVTGLGPGFGCPQLTPAVAVTRSPVLFLLVGAWGLLSSWPYLTLALTGLWAPLNHCHIVHLAPDQEVQAVGSPYPHPFRSMVGPLALKPAFQGAKRSSGVNTASSP